MAKAATATSFESILDTAADAVERPMPPPAGTFDCIVKGLYEEGVSTQKKTPFVRFTYVFQNALEDVNEEELAEWLGDAKLSEKSIKDTYYTTPDALFRLTEAMEAMGVDLDGKTVRAALAETPNSSLRVVVQHRTPDGSDQVFAEVKRVMKAD